MTNSNKIIHTTKWVISHKTGEKKIFQLYIGDKQISFYTKIIVFIKLLMGLDIVTYNKEEKRVEIFEIEESFHHWLFHTINLNKSEFKKLYKLQDYYKTNLYLTGIDLQEFIKEVELLQERYPFRKEIETIKDKISPQKIIKIHIGSD